MFFIVRHKFTKTYAILWRKYLFFQLKDKNTTFLADCRFVKVTTLTLNRL